MRKLSVVLLVVQSWGCGAGSHPPELVVTTFSPRPASDDPEGPIQFRFNRPVVEEIEVARPVAAPPVAIEPAVPVAAHWEDRQTLVLKPTAPLRASTRYKVTLTGALAERASEKSFSFVHRPLQVQAVQGVDPERLMSEPSLIIPFNQPVAPADVAAHCLIGDAQTGDPTALRATGEPAETITVTVAKKLLQGRDYELRCQGLTGAGGDTPLAETYRVKLHTFPAFAVAGFKPQGNGIGSDDARIEMRFSTPVTPEEITKRVSSDPAIPGLKKGWLDDTRTIYATEGNLEANVAYTVKLAAGTKDVFGQKLADAQTFTFTTGDASPRLSMERGIFAVETERKGYPVWTRSMHKFAVECGRVPRDKVVKLLTSDMNYDPWYYPGQDVPGIDWKKLGLAKKKTDIKTGNKKNKWVLAELELDQLCAGEGSDHRGLYLAELTSKELKRDEDRYWRFKPRQRVLANVTNLGLVLKAGPASGLLWVTSIKDGQPVAGADATVFTPAGDKVFAGKTDASGILRLPGTTKLLRQPGAQDKSTFEEESYEDYDSYRAQRLIVVVDKDGDVAVVDGNWANGIQVWNFGVTEDRKSGLTRIRGFIQSDRGIYRPGEEVHFKGLVRDVEIGKAARVPREKKAKIHVEDARGQGVYDKELALSPYGGFFFDLPLSEEATLGDYYVTATIKDQAFREKFIVQKFRKVEYEVKLSGSTPGLGREVKFKTQADYLFGAPVAGAQVKYTVSRRPYFVSFPSFPEFMFADLGSLGDDYWYPYWRHRNANFVTDGEGRTDDKGAFTFAFTDPEKEVKGSQDYIAEVSVTDQTDQTISKEVALTAHATDFYLGLHENEFVQAVDMPFGVNVVAVDKEGKQVGVKATMSWTRRRPDCTYTDGYRAYVSCTSKIEKIWERDIDIPATGMGIEKIVPKAPGEYVVRIEAQDKHGRKVIVSDWLWVIGKGEAFWSGDESDRMTVVANKQKYEPGDTARLVPRTSLSQGTALVTLERNGIIDAWVTPMASSGQGVDVALKDAYAPNVYASIAVVQGRTGEGDRRRPRFQMGIVELSVSPEKNRLKVEVATDKPQYQPGDEVGGTIRVVGADGKPVRAEVSLSVADEGVLQLIAYQTPDPMKTFFAPWGLGVDAATTWNRIARLASPMDDDSEEGGDGGGEGDDGEGKIRSRFVNSAYWAPALVTDDDGRIRFKFQAPDNLTAFRLMAVAADATSRFGSADNRMTLKKPLLVQPVLPRFLAAGDAAEVGVVVRNYTGAAGTAKVTAKATGVKLAVAEKSVKIAKDGSARVAFPVDVGMPASGTDAATFTFGVKMAGDSDGVQMSLPLGRPLTVDKTTLAKGRFEGATVVPLAWDPQALPADSYVEVAIDRTGMADLGQSLRYLIEYPYGCLEQTMSRFIPLVKVKDLSETLGLDELRGPKLATFIKAGVAKVYRFQHEDGNFSLWQAGEPYPHLTVYALYGLNEAVRAGVDVRKDVLDKGVAAVKRWVNGKRDLGPRGDGATMAMAAYVLAEMKQPDAALDARLYEARAALPVSGQAFLLQAMYLGKADPKLVRGLEDEILSRLKIDGDTAVVRETEGAYWLDHYMSSNVRSTAITLSALLRVDAQNPLIDKLVDGLKRDQLPSGRWMNTQDNLYSLVALADYARRATAGQTTATVILGGDKLAQKRLDGAQALSFRRTLDKVKPGAIRIETDGAVRYSVRLVTARLDAAKDPVDRGFSVRRAYVDPDTGKEVTAFQTGQLLKVKVDIANATERHWVAVTDPLPAGFEIVNTKLATSVKRSDGYTGGRDDRWWNWSWSYVELGDDRADAFADVLRPGTHTFSYLVRATLPGRFTAAPARVEAMYEPDVAGRTAPADVVVAERKK